MSRPTYPSTAKANRLLPWLGLLPSLLLTAHAADVYWDGGSYIDYWLFAENWQGDSLPTSADTVYFEDGNNRTTRILSGNSYTVSYMNFGGTANNYSFTLGRGGTANLTVSNSLYLGYGVSGASAQFLIENDSMLSAGSLILGASGSTGLLDLVEGDLSVTTFVTLGSSSAGSGVLQMDGSDTSFSAGTNLNVGYYGTGTANISGGTATVGTDLRVGYFNGAYGELTLSNSASMTVSDDFTTYAGEGTITQTLGSDLTVTDQVFLGEISTGDGDWSLDDSSASVGNDLFVGYSGTGALSLSNGASLDVADYLVVARDSGSHGTLSLNDSSSSLSAAYAIVGGSISSDGGNGILTLNDGSMSVSNSTTVRGAGVLTLNGGTLTTTSLSTITGSGSLVHNDGTLHLNGGNWDFENTADWIIESADGSGTATVQYTDATVDHSNYDLTIGDTKAGKMTLGTSASVRVDHLYMGSGDGGDGKMTLSGNPNTGTPYLQANNFTVGDAISGNGTAALDFPTGTNKAGFLAIGDADFSSLQGADIVRNVYLSNSTETNGVWRIQGNLDFDLGAASSIAELYIGHFAGDFGRVEVADGSNLLTQDDLFIGYKGEGTLSLAGDASLQVTDEGSDLYIGRITGSRGIWEGANGSVNWNLYLGYDGQGEIYMGTGDALSVGNEVGLAYGDNAVAVLEMEDAYLSAAEIYYSKGAGTITLNDSTLETNAFYLNSNSTSIFAATNSTWTNTGELSVGYSSSYSGQSVMTISGGSLQAGQDFRAGRASSADVTLADGAQVSVGGNLYVADALPSDGSHSAVLRLTTANLLSPTFLDITGNASVEDFGTWTTDTYSEVRIGDGDMSTITTKGFVLVSDTSETGSSFTMVDDNDAQSATFGGELLVGWNAGETGTVNLAGTATVLTTDDHVRLGENGIATVTLDDGAVWNANGSIFDLADQTGNATLSLDNASQLNSGYLYAGDGTGTATLHVRSGSRLDSNMIVLGDDASTGTLNVDAATVAMSGNLYIGDGSSTENGVGVALFENGSVLEQGNKVYVGYEGTGSLTLDDSSWVQDASDISYLSIGTYASGDGTVVLQNSATVTIEYLYVGDGGTGSLTVDGTNSVLTQLNGTTVFRVGFDPGSAGTITIQNGGSHLYQDVNDNSVLIGYDGVGQYTVTGAGSSSAFSSKVTVGYKDTSAGSSLNVLDGASFTGTDLTLDNTASLSIDGVGTELALSGTLTFGDTETASLTGGATLKTPAVIGNLVNTSGTFSPGTSPAHTTITGDYTQESGGTLEIELGGTTQGTEYDYLDISGTAALNGIIDIVFIDSYEPSGGESFTILSATSLTDNGYTINLPTLSSSYLEWEAVESATGIVLNVNFTKDLSGFRAQYGLATDGSDDASDWSGNGLANIAYLIYGLGDPASATIDRSRLPQIDTTGSIIFSYVRPESVAEFTFYVMTSGDFATWQDVDTAAIDYQAVSAQTTSLGDGYEQVDTTFNKVSGEDGRYYRVEVNY